MTQRASGRRARPSPGRRAVAAGLALLFPVLLTAAGDDKPMPTAAEQRLKGDVAFLADDAREGRSPGGAGIEAAAAYIAGSFESAGLKPAPGSDGFFQPFTLGGQAKLASAGDLRFHGPDGKSVVATLNKDYTPLAVGTGGTLAATPVVFAGYGITAHDPAKGLDYDDYAGLDVKGKAVLLLRREPQQDREDSPFDGRRPSDFATFRHKATNAFQHGAAAVLLVNDFAGLGSGADELFKFYSAGAEVNSPIPFLFLSRDCADRLLAAAGAPDLQTLERRIDETLKPSAVAPAGWSADVAVEITRTAITTRNVVGVLEGSGPLADETVVVGAHYDHLGRGGVFSGSLAFLSKEIHNGADDNASGTATVLELARRLARRADPLPRRVVFVAFSGEERGLLGSKHYVEHPPYPLDRTVMMLNFDMVGRLNARQELTVYGTGTSPRLDELVDALGSSQGFVVKKIADGYGPSDQQSFYIKGVPVLFAFTGTHLDYHRPSDDMERLNVPGMARVADLGELLLLDVARRPRRPEFVKVASKGGHGGGDPGRVSVSAYLGSIPDYNEDIKGVKLNGVREGSPAEQGGMRAGDVVVGFGGKPVATIYDYTESLAHYKPGDTVEVVVERDGKPTPLKVTLGKKPSE